MLAVAQEREVEGDLFLHDMGEGLGFRAGTFDGVISVSALQWLCNADRKTQHPPKRLHCFFSSLYACMARGAKAVFQFYPENPDQVRYSFIVLYRLTWNSVCVFADGTNHATGNEGGVYRRRGHRLPQQHESKKDVLVSLYWRSSYQLTKGTRSRCR
jgi:hypothetical protein